MKCFNVILFFMFLGACNSQNNPGAEEQMSDAKLKDTLVSANQQLVKQESDEIDQYVKRRKWEMTTTGTGLRYMSIQQGEGEKPEVGMFAKVAYKVFLLDGTLCYSSDDDGPREFAVGRDHVERGLHEGIQYMQVGGKARFILPSHLAHGLVGDGNKIPPKSSVLYEIELLGLRR